MRGREQLLGYGFQSAGHFFIIQDRFVMEIRAESILQLDRCIYAFLVGEEIVRIGSSKAKLQSRFRDWQRDVSRALQNTKSPTSLREAAEWRRVLGSGPGEVFARRGAIVETPIGEINAYLAEEKALIERHKPRFCKR